MSIRTMALAGLALCLSTPALAETHFDNVDGISIDRFGRVDRFSGMVVNDEGRIVQLLDFGDRPTVEIDYYEDMQGRVVVPGMVDSHAHVMDVGLAKMTLDLSQTRSITHVQALVAAYAQRFPNRPWLIGHGWNQEQWGLDRFPNAAELDEVSDRPVVLHRVDGHALWANSAALAAAGITAQTDDPAGGRILRQAGSREPSGVLVDNAMALVLDHVPPPRAEDREQALVQAQREFLSHGVTSVADMGTGIEDWMAFRRAGDEGWLQMRIMAYAASVPEMLLIGGTGPTPWLYEDRLRLNGVKLWLDGALGSRGAVLKAEYHDDAGNRGLEVLDGTQMRNLMSRASMDGFQVAIHAIGDAANADALAAIDQLSADFEGDRRWRIEHAQVVDPADIAMFGQHGIIASMQPVHQSSDRLMAEARLGPDRLDGAYAWRSIANAGASLAFGSDAPVELSRPLEGLAVAISRTGPDGEPFGGWMAEETVSRETALAAFTAGGAYAGFAEGRFGSLALGERADFLVLDGDPLISSAENIRGITLLQTWIGGQRVWSSEDASGE